MNEYEHKAKGAFAVKPLHNGHLFFRENDSDTVYAVNYNYHTDYLLIVETIEDGQALAKLIHADEYAIVKAIIHPLYNDVQLSEEVVYATEFVNKLIEEEKKEREVRQINLEETKKNNREKLAAIPTRQTLMTVSGKYCALVLEHKIEHESIDRLVVQLGFVVNPEDEKIEETYFCMNDTLSENGRVMRKKIERHLSARNMKNHEIIVFINSITHFVKMAQDLKKLSLI